MPKKGASKAKKKDEWPDDGDTEQRLTENMEKLMSNDSSAASSVRKINFFRLASRPTVGRLVLGLVTAAVTSCSFIQQAG